MTGYTYVTKIDDFRFEIPRKGAMNVPGKIFASEKILPQIVHEQAAAQVQNVAMLPGIVGYSLAMPDIHWGYGFPIGGVGAFREDTGVISPGGIGYDISCGVRLYRTHVPMKQYENRIDEILQLLFAAVPSGVGSTGRLKLSKKDMVNVLTTGAQWAVSQGYGTAEDIPCIEDKGYMKEADPDTISQRARERGLNQLGTLGSGNHFLEIQEVTDIYDERIASIFGVFHGQMVIMVHTGSRGLGYQVCDDFIRVMVEASRRYQIKLPDRQLACAPIRSPEGKRYFGAMAAATNFARANRQIIGGWVQETMIRVLKISPKDLGMQLVYDVSHNIGKMEEHVIDGKKHTVCVHRKGATRAFPPGHRELPDVYQTTGQPVIVPGSMGTASYLMAGTEQALSETFGSTCHGAGRVLSRSAAKRKVRGQEIKQQLHQRNILVYTDSYSGLAEEAPMAYKDVDDVVDICHQAGISKKVCRMKPRGVIKG
ncbi:MAG: RNA-splicing ligase RtcB [Elusimicrobia bacterium]|nr:RNA-splicing ligase RtcB [Elusimicrobiota bacterium]